jgi:hypothetical protein
VARVHTYSDTSAYEYRQLIEAVWTLDDTRWREVERGLREQGERRDVTRQAAKQLMVLHDFLIKGRRWRAAAHGEDLAPPVAISKPRWRAAVQSPTADPRVHSAVLPRRIPIPISRPRWWEAAHSTEVPLMFLIKGRRGAVPQGADVPPLATRAWDAEQALAALNVTEVPFDPANSNLLGYARGRTIAVSPLSPFPHRTRFHELAHVLLGHTIEGDRHNTALTPRNLRECEAETVAMLCCAALDLPGVESSGRYVQHWWGTGKIPRRSAERILKAVDQIIEAGTRAGADAP